MELRFVRITPRKYPTAAAIVVAGVELQFKTATATLSHTGRYYQFIRVKVSSYRARVKGVFFLSLCCAFSNRMPPPPPVCIL